MRIALAALAALLTQQSAAQNVQSVAPNGRLVAYAHEDALWLLATRPGAKPQKIDDVATYFCVPRWSPGGDRLAYYSSRTGTLQLWLYDLRARRTRQMSFVEGGITPDPAAGFGGWVNDPLRYSWSPDGKRIAFASQVLNSSDETRTASFPSPQALAKGEPIVLTNVTPPEWTLYGVVSYGHPANRTFNETSLNIVEVPQVQPVRDTQLFVLDVASGEASQLTSDSAGYFTPEWSPDGTHLAYMSAGQRELYRFGTVETNIFVRDLKTGNTRQVTQGPTQKTLPRWSRDGKWIAYQGSDITAGFVRGEARVYVVADGGGAQRHVSRGIDRQVLGYEWSTDGTEILVSYRDGLMIPLSRIDLQHDKVTPVSPAEAVVESFTSSQGGILWAQLSDPNGATSLKYSGRYGVRTLLELKPASKQRAARHAEALEWKNKRGEVIEGMLVYPKDHSLHRRYPLVVDTYGAGTLDLSGYDHSELISATADYVVFRPNHRAPHMWVNGVKSPIYDAAAVGFGGMDVMADDIMSGVDMLIGRGNVDPDRMCLFGFSNGGLEGEQLLTRTDRFKCAVFQSPSVSDWLVSFFLTTDDEEVIHWMYGIAPWQRPSLYTGLSPVFLADKITTPILLAVGDRESAVIATLEMYNVLRYLKKDVTLLRYPAQGHGFSGAAAEDFMKRTAAFFAHYLKG